MAKNKTQSALVKSVHPWEGFSNLVVTKDDHQFEISFVPKTNRGVLTKNGEFKISDVSLTTLKRDAQLRYGIHPDSWSIKKQET